MPGAAAPFDLEGKLRIDLSQVEQLPVEIQAALAQAGTKPTNLQVNVLDAQAKAQLATAKKDLATLNATTAKPKVQLETAQATRGLADLKAEFAKNMAAIDQSVAKTQAGIDKLGGAGAGGTAAGTTVATPSGASMGTKVMAGSMVLAGLGGATLILKSASDAAMGAIRQTESVNRAFGASGEIMNKYAQDLSAATGYQAMMLRESQVAFKGIADTVPMTNERLNELVGLVTDMAETSAIPQYRDNIQGVTGLLLQSLQGTGRGLKELGYNLDDVYMKDIYLNGALKDTWGTMTPTQKATEKLNALFQQTADIQGAAGRSTGDAAKQLRAENAVLEARIALGNALLPILQKFNSMIASMPKWLLEVTILGGALLAIAAPVGMAISMLKSTSSIAGNVAKMAGGAGQAGTLETGAATAAATLETGAATAAGTLETGAATAAATLEGGAAAAGGTVEGGAVAAAGTIEGGAAASAGTLEGGAVAAGATTEAAAVTAAATLEAGAAAASAELAAGGAKGGLAGMLKGQGGGATLGGLVPTLPKYAGVGTIGGALITAAPLIAAGVVGLLIQKDIAKGADKARAEADKWGNQKILGERYMQQATKGIDWGVVFNEQLGLYEQGINQHRDVAALGSTTLNKYGQQLGQGFIGYSDAALAGLGNQEYSGRKVNQVRVAVTLNDQTAAGVKATQLDAGSNSPGPY